MTHVFIYLGSAGLVFHCPSLDMMQFEAFVKILGALHDLSVAYITYFSTV